MPVGTCCYRSYKGPPLGMPMMPYRTRMCHVGSYPTYILMGYVGCQRLFLHGGAWARARSMACPCWNMPAHASIDKGVAAGMCHVLTDTARGRARNGMAAEGHQEEAMCRSIPIL